MKPKHHFVQHIPLDALMHGPPRGYWCFSFEGMHQVMKRYARGSSFVNVGKRIMGLWTKRVALHLMECSQEAYARQVAPDQDEANCLDQDE